MAASRLDRRTREYLIAATLGLSAAAIVYFPVQASEDVRCYRHSVRIAIAGNETLGHCEANGFGEVRRQIAEQRRRLASDENFVPDAPKQGDGNAALVVWTVLLTMTAGLAGFGAVRASFMILYALRPRWTLTASEISTSALLAVAILAIPVLVLRFGSGGDFRLGPYDRVFLSLVRPVTYLIVLLSLPSALGLRLIGRVTATREHFSLGSAGELGAQLRLLISLLGGVLSLAVLGTASRFQAIDALPGGEAAPASIAIVWGGVYAIALAALFIPVYERWAAMAGSQVALELRRQFHPDDDHAGYTSAELSTRKELNTMLGLSGALGGLQSSLSVLGPVIAAAIASLVA